MEDIKKEILADVKMLSGLTGEEHDEILLFLIEDAVNSALAYCRLEFLPRQLFGLIAQMVVKLWRNGDYGNSDADFAVKAIAEGDRRIEFDTSADSVLGEYRDRLKPYVNKVARLPSELDAKEARA